MDCPICSHTQTKVLESRSGQGAIRRRRSCLSCQNRFTTYERAVFHLSVRKRSGDEEIFSIEKIRTSLARACSKRDDEELLPLIGRIQQKVLQKKSNPIKTADIGRIVLRELKKFDKIAYLRYATIHKEIDDPYAALKELELITKK